MRVIISNISSTQPKSSRTDFEDVQTRKVAKTTTVEVWFVVFVLLLSKFKNSLIVEGSFIDSFLLLRTQSWYNPIFMAVFPLLLLSVS